MNLTFEQVKPETLAVIEANAKRFGLSVDDYLQSILPQKEQNLALKAEKPPEESGEEREIKRQKSIAWIKSHREEYGGLYVALDGDKLIATGQKHGDALKSAFQKGFKKPFVGLVYPLDYVGYWGGWG
jgi:Family of unknown function (DUF5678)